MTDWETCLETVRAHDRDRFIAALFAPDAARPHLMALYAFNAELLRIRTSVTEPRIGLIRLQWWHDTLDSPDAGAALGHPVASALAAAIAAHDLPRPALHDLVAAREFDFDDEPMASLTDLEAHLGATSSMLIQLGAMILDRGAAPRVAEAAGLAGVAHGLAVILHDPARRDRYLPQDMDVGAAAAHARLRLVQARALVPALPRAVKPAFLPAAVTGRLLNAVERRPQNPPAVSALSRQLAIWWHARREDF